MTIMVRPITPNDLDAWVELRRALWSGAISTIIVARWGSTFSMERSLNRHMALFIAETSDESTGCALAGFAEVSLRVVTDAQQTPAAHLEGWYVSPALRRQGVGRRLIDAVLDWARSRGCATITSDTSSTYAASSIPAHLACGFDRDSTVAENLGPPEDATTSIGFSRRV